MENVTQQSRITLIPGLCGGKPTIRGMRITVSNVLEMLAGGMTEKQILHDYPYLELEDIKECLRFAARVSSYSFEMSEATG
ncbi:MAG: DUF433 domain-containing protein [Ignavibacteriae bacterium]|nr:DUF433 domain-containing protein [Ignavibacteriota bacterium]